MTSDTPLEMRFDPKKLRLERLTIDSTYHSTYTFHGLKGAIAERWAHGPIFGAVAEIGTQQLNLSPVVDDVIDEKFFGYIGIRTSGLVAEGKTRTRELPEIAGPWFEDIYAALKPRRTVAIKAELFGLYPLTDPWRATQKLRRRYYQDDALSELAGAQRTHAAVEIFASDEQPQRTIIVGVYGPPHKGAYFMSTDKRRDSHWWMGVRIAHAAKDDDGLSEPLTIINDVLQSALMEWERVGRNVLPNVVD
jgi:hypothetical protein